MRNIMRFFAVSTIVVGAWVLDRVTKIFFMARPPATELSSAAEGSFHFSQILTTTHHQNFGLIANTPVPQPIIILFTTIVVIGLCGYLVKEMKHTGGTSLGSTLPLALVLGGALGNLYDRVTRGFVFDWILLFQRSVINVADICIAVGILWFVYMKSRRTRGGSEKV